MLQLNAYADADTTVSDTLTLSFDLRTKSRLRAKLDSGAEVAVMLPRGNVLRDGDRLQTDQGSVVAIRAANESVSTVRAAHERELTRLAYHLGNRHVALQLGDGWLRYQHDHVLDDMVRGLGGEVVVEQAPFEPEAGAYEHGGHGHAHGGEHAHG